MRSASAHRGEERELIAFAQPMIGAHVIVGHREQREWPVRAEDREAARYCIPGCLGRPTVRELELDPVTPRRLAVAGEQPDLHLHGRPSRCELELVRV